MSPPALNGEWDRWSDAWRTERVADAELARLIAGARRARQGIFVIRMLSFAIPALALAAVGVALYHAASVMELALGCVVAIGICWAWLLDVANRRVADEHADEPPAQYVILRRTLCLRRLRFARLVWIVAALDLMFLFPWWAGGMRYHGFGFRFVHLTSLWGPLALIVLAVIIAARIRTSAASELRALASDE